MIARRQFLAICLAGTAALALAVPAAEAQPSVIGAIRVDVSALESQGWGGHALAIKLGMERELAAALGADYRRGRGTTLVVTVRGVFLNSYAGGGGGGGGRWGGGGGGNTSDSFDSVATLVAPGNRVIATYPVLSTVSAFSAGPWYLPDIDQRRLDGLIKHNAAWIKRYVTG